MKKLFIGKLPYAATEHDLRELFAAYEPLGSVKVVMDKMTGRSRGFAFVEIQDDAKAVEAISALNDASIEGMRITVNEARPQEQREGGGFSPRGNDRGQRTFGYSGGRRSF